MYNEASAWNSDGGDKWGNEFDNLLYEVGIRFNYKLNDTASLFGVLYYKSVYNYSGPWEAEELATLELGFSMRL